MSQIKKCTSKQIPCPAGERCPEHRVRNEALKAASKNKDYAAYERIKVESIKSEALRVAKIKQAAEVEAEALLELTDPFASNSASGIPASSYNSYHEETVRILETMSSSVLELPESKTFALGQEKKFTGRDGATFFEKNFLKPILFGNKEGFIESVNKDSKFKLLNIIDMEDEQDGTDTKNRTFADIALRISDENGKTSLIPVNIKSTLGSSSDNVGGWAAFQFMMAGKSKGKGAQKGNTLDKTTPDSIAAATGASDYFLWSFNKGESKPFDSAHAVSLLQFSLKQFRFNGVQSFPIQADVGKLVNARSVLDKTKTIADRRTEWCVQLNQAYETYYSVRTTRARKNLEAFLPKKVL